MSVPLKPHERIKLAFEGEDERLVKRFGIGYDLVRKWKRDSDGDYATGHPSYLDRVRDMIDEALVIDITGQKARLIASDGIEYFEYLTKSHDSSINPISEVSNLLLRVAEINKQINVHDIRRLKGLAKQDLLEKISDASCALERIRALVSMDEDKTNAEEFYRAGRTNGSKGAGKQSIGSTRPARG